MPVTPVQWHLRSRGHQPSRPSGISNAIYNGCLQPLIEDAVGKLAIVSANHPEISQLPARKQKLFPSVTGHATDRFDRIKQLLSELVAQAEVIIAALVQMMTAWLASCVMPLLLLPLTMLWLLMSLIKNWHTDIQAASAAIKAPLIGP